MGKIRLKDLARTMKVPEQDLMFKLKSIGVRLDGPDPEIDSDIIQAILQGKNLPQPREVILRDQNDAPLEAPEPTRPAPAPKAAPAAHRGSRRSMIQRVEPKIRELEIHKEGAEADAAMAAAADGTATEAPVAAVAADSAPAPGPQTAAAEPQAAAASEAKVVAKSAATAKPAKGQAPSAQAAAAKAAQPVPGKPAENKAPEKVPLKSNFRPKAKLIHKGEKPTTPPAASQPPAGARRPPTRPSRPPRSSRYRGGGGRPPHGRRQQRSHVRSEPVPDRKPASERGHRRAKKREEGGTPQNIGGLQFKEAAPEGAITITHGMTVREFAEKLGVKAKDLIKSLFSYGVMATINHTLEPETAKQLAADLGVEVMEVSFEEEIQLQHDTEIEDTDVGTEPRAPVVTVMGHVDHGKTTLLDAIRKTNVVSGEAGGITQHIGAYHVDVNDRQIVFLDTPGHEAFTMMRARGASVTDIVVLVVAADDGVMPQTLEAIDHAKAAKVPLIVAINKVDKANANLDRVRKELADHNLLVEDWGGEIVSVPLSALQGEGISDLLEMIVLNADLLELKASPTLPARGVILEARKEVGRGIIATAVIQDGSLAIGDVFVAGSTWGKVRTMLDDQGQRLKTTGPATAVEVTGFDELPSAGDLLQAYEDESKVREIASFRSDEERQRDLAPRPARLSLETLFDHIGQEEAKELPVIVKADVHGSVEVLRETLTKLSTEKVEINVLHASVGGITTNDIVLASASNAIVVGFNVRPERNALQLAEKEEVEIRLHTVIYELLDELKDAMAGLLDPTFKEVHRGTAEVRQTFKVPKAGVIGGCHVVDGVIPRSAGIRLVRDSIVVYEGKISSLRRIKDDVNEVRSGFDCGIGLDSFQDLKPGDSIEAFVREEVAATL